MRLEVDASARIKEVEVVEGCRDVLQIFVDQSHVRREMLPDCEKMHLGWSDMRIACYFGVEPVKVLALREYYGFVDRAQNSWVWRMRRRDRMKSEG